MGFDLGNFAGDVLGGIADIFGADMASDSADRATDAAFMSQNLDRQMQREFAQMGIRWKVDDARAAGIDPLVALGAQTHSYSPVTVGTQPNTAMAEMVGRMGQRVGRSVSDILKEEDSVTKEKDKLELENQRLQNQYLGSQIARLNSAQGQPNGGVISGAGLMLDGQPSSRLVQDQPLQRTVSQPGRPEKEAGAVSDYTHVKTPYGYAIVPAKDVKERIEDTFIPEMTWAIRNNLMPNFTPDKFKPDAKPPKGFDDWQWSYSMQQYVPVKKMGFKKSDFDRIGGAIQRRK